MQAPAHPDDPAADAPYPYRYAMNGLQAQAGARNMQQLIQLRWIAVVGQVVTILLVHSGFGIPLALEPMLLVVAGLAAFNLVSLLYWRGRARVTDAALLVGLLVDVASLTIQLYLSGGIANPFAFLYLLQVVLGAVLLRPASGWIVVAATGLSLAGLAVFRSPLDLPAQPGGGLSDPYVQGLLICFVLVAILLVVFITRIGRIIRARDAHLADLRQRAAEEEHIVRMGLLASGAAHELGTPLSTLAVILGDWQHLPHFTSDPELLQDVTEMQAQVLRCKAIVTGILQSAGETRGEAPRETTMRAFLDDLVDEWQRSRPDTRLHYDNRIEHDFAIVSDEGLKQMLCNVLDNALEVSPGHVALEASGQDGQLVVRVSDRGPGFSPEMLAHFGKPYQSSKGSPGRGLGLFLSVNVARTLGGTIAPDNPAAGGAAVTIRLPLSALALEQQDDDP